MERTEARMRVYRKIDGERDYQDEQPQNNPNHDAEHSVADWILFMEYHLNRAKENMYKLDSKGAMDQIRKVTALGVVAMEYNETPDR